MVMVVCLCVSKQFHDWVWSLWVDVDLDVGLCWSSGSHFYRSVWATFFLN